MATHRSEKLHELVRKTASEFIARESNPGTLITVTDITQDTTGLKVHILLSVYPENKGQAAVDFLSRRASDFQEFFTEKVKIRKAPHFTFGIDKGEKNRQRIDELIHSLVPPPENK